MSLKFKRHYPIILLLVAIPSFLAFAMGDQPIIAYTLKAESQQIEQAATTRFDIANDADETLYVNSELVNDEYLTQYSEIADGVLYKTEVGSTRNYE